MHLPNSFTRAECDTRLITRAEFEIWVFFDLNWLQYQNWRIQSALLPTHSSFPRVSALSEMQTASYRIWTWLAVSVSYCDNHYTTIASTPDNLKYSLQLEKNLVIYSAVFALMLHKAVWIGHQMRLELTHEY